MLWFLHIHKIGLLSFFFSQSGKISSLWVKGKLQRLLLPLDGWINIYPIRPYIKEWAFAFFPPQNTVSVSRQLWMVLVSLPVWASILLMHHLAFAGKGLETNTISISGKIPRRCFTVPYILCCRLCLSKINTRAVKTRHGDRTRTFCTHLTLIFHGYKWLIKGPGCDVWDFVMLVWCQPVLAV